jgi:hypothetical protein
MMLTQRFVSNQTHAFNHDVIRVVLDSEWEKKNKDTTTADMKLYPENKPNSFRTKFFEPIILEGSWEVAITDISFFLNNINIERQELMFVLLTKHPYDGTALPNQTFYPIDIPPGYLTPERLCNWLTWAINEKVFNPKHQTYESKTYDEFFTKSAREAITPRRRYFTVDFDVRTQKAKMSAYTRAVTLYSRGRDTILSKLGFDTSFFSTQSLNAKGDKNPVFDIYFSQLEERQTHFAHRHPSIKTYEMMKVYLDCIHDTIVGDTLSH